MSDRIILVLSGEVTLDDFSIAISKLKGLMYALSKEVAMGAEIEWIIEELSTSDATTIVRGVGSEEDRVGKGPIALNSPPNSSHVLLGAPGRVSIAHDVSEGP